jgi:tRNA pseudouridine38-40 synthase
VKTYKAGLEYQGTAYSGFQIQRDRRTIQGEVEAALSRLVGRPVKIVGAGRTDAGVHALGQVISLECDCPIPTDRLADALNGFLPRDIRSFGFEQVRSGFDARRDAKARCYRYLIVERARPVAILRDLAYRSGSRLDVDAMVSAASCLPGTNDFASFGTRVSPKGTTLRTVNSIDIRRSGGFVTITVWADAFLKGMVRAMAGTLIDVGSGRIEPAQVQTILQSRDRNSVTFNAPPAGLYLMRVVY